MNELSPDVGAIVEEKHDAARARRRVRRGEAGRSAADDQHVAARVELRIVALRTIVRIDAAKAGHGPDRGLERLPARPEKCLVVEAGGHEG